MNNILGFGDRLKDLLSERAIDVNKFSQDTGFPPYEIYHWWQEKYYPSLANLIKIADYFNVSLDFLLGRESLITSDNFHTCPPFHNQLMQIIQEKDTNIHKLSKASMVDRNTIYSWLKAKRQPQVDALIRLATALDISVDYLVGREN